MTKEELEKYIAAHPGPEGRAAGTLHRRPPRRRQADGHPLLDALQRAPRAGRGEPARGRRADQQRIAQGLPDQARRRLRQGQLPRQRHGLDGPDRPDRGRHRTVRGLRGRALQLQGRRSSRSSPSSTSRRPTSWPSTPSTCRTWRRTSPSRTSTRTPTAAPSRRSASCRSSTPPATPAAACRPPPSTSRTTRSCARRKARRKSCSRTSWTRSTARAAQPIAMRVLDPSPARPPQLRRLLQLHPLPRALARPRTGHRHAARRRARRHPLPPQGHLLRRSKSAKPTSSASGTSSTRRSTSSSPRFNDRAALRHLRRPALPLHALRHRRSPRPRHRRAMELAPREGRDRASSRRHLHRRHRQNARRHPVSRHRTAHAPSHRRLRPSPTPPDQIRHVDAQRSKVSIAKLKDIPVDITPVFSAAGEKE